MNLVEKVARALASDPEVPQADQWKSWIEDAKTVIDIVRPDVLEEAAKWHSDRSMFIIATAIRKYAARALGEK